MPLPLKGVESSLLQHGQIVKNHFVVGKTAFVILKLLLMMLPGLDTLYVGFRKKAAYAATNFHLIQTMLCRVKGAADLLQFIQPS